MAKYVEPHLIQPTFLIDYPRDVSPLAKGSPTMNARWSALRVYLPAWSSATPSASLNDPIDQLQRFVDETTARGTATTRRTRLTKTSSRR
jgi:lysyl-tRNA synthetase class 2